MANMKARSENEKGFFSDTWLGRPPQPPVTGPVTCPAHEVGRQARAAVDERLGIFLGQAARPFLKSLLGELGAFGVGILQGSTKLHRNQKKNRRCDWVYTRSCP